KFGKSEAGAIWLDEAKTSVFDFYQFFLNVSDEDAVDYLKLFTMLSQEKIDNLLKASQDHPSERIAQKTLAYEVTAVVHGKDRAQSAQRATEALFGGAHTIDFSEETKSALKKELPGVDAGSDLVEALVSSGLATSLS